MIVLTDDEWSEQRSTLLPQFSALFTDHADSPDLGTKLVEIVNAFPTSAAAEAMADALLDAVHSYPTLLEGMVQGVLTALANSDVQSLKVEWAGQVELFAYVFKIEVGELLKTILFETQLNQPARVTVEATNRTLTTALLSASIVKHKLISQISSPFRFAYEGLQLPGNVPKKKRQEVVAVAVCLQLAVAGAPMMEQDLETSWGAEVIVGALKALKANNVIKHPQGILLLDETIVNAENGFTRTSEVAEVWATLFPE